MTRMFGLLLSSGKGLDQIGLAELVDHGHDEIRGVGREAVPSAV